MLGVDELEFVLEQPHADAPTTLIGVCSEKAQVVVIFAARMSRLEPLQHFEVPVGFWPKVFARKAL